MKQIYKSTKAYFLMIHRAKYGYIALTTVIILSAVSLGIIATVSLLAIGEAQSALSVATGESTLTLTEGCMEDALLNSLNSSTYTGGLLTMPEGNCNVTVSKAGSVWTVGASIANGIYTRSVQSVVTRGATLTVNSWQELAIAPPTNTLTPTNTNTPTPTNTNTPTPTNTPTLTPTNTNTPTPTSTPALAQKENTSAAQHSAGTASLSWTQTVGSNANRLLLVGISTYATGATTVKYNGTSMTRLALKANASQAYSEIWYLLAPATLTNASIVVTLPSSVAVVAGSVSYYNVPQSGTFGTSVLSSGTTTPAQFSVTSTTSQVIFDNFADQANTGTWSPTNQTQLWYNGASNGGGASFVNGLVTSTTLKWTNNTGNETWADVAVPIN